MTKIPFQKSLCNFISLCHYPSTLYLNLYQNHFSYIKDTKKYTKSYCCTRCGMHWKHVGKLHSHERTCKTKVHFQFPGSTYKTPPTIFQVLEDEGFTIPEHLKYFPYRATIDFDTEKLTWNAKHIPPSMSVCSNVLPLKSSSVNQELQTTHERDGGLPSGNQSKELRPDEGRVFVPF